MGSINWIDYRLHGLDIHFLLVLGDFNGHLSMLESDRGDDDNGRMIIRLMEEYNLHLMNADERCRGIYTWGRGNQRSAIDMILVNYEVFKYCGSMTIDVNGEEISFSDHNMITLELRLRESGCKKFGKKNDKEGKVVRECIRKGEVWVDKFLEELRSRWVQGMGFVEMWDTLVKTQNDILVKKLSLKTGLRKGERLVESEWVTEDFKLAIKKRNQLNREKRYCVGEARQRLVDEWKLQRSKVHQMVRDLKGAWEAMKTKEARDSRDHGKTTWRVIRELQGKTRMDEKAFVYIDGEKCDVETVWDKIVDSWSCQFQKRGNSALSTWEGGWGPGLRESYMLDIKSMDNLKEHLDMAKDGNLTEVMKWEEIGVDEVVDRVKNLKNNTAAGPDRVKGGLLKEIIKDEGLCKIFAESFKGICEMAELPDSWKTTNTSLIKKTAKPGIKDHRPIAVCSVGYKLFWAAARHRMEDQLIRYGLVKENQFGFTNGGGQLIIIISFCST